MIHVSLNLRSFCAKPLDQSKAVKSCKFQCSTGRLRLSSHPSQRANLSFRASMFLMDTQVSPCSFLGVFRCGASVNMQRRLSFGEILVLRKLATRYRIASFMFEARSSGFFVSNQPGHLPAQGVSQVLCRTVRVTVTDAPSSEI